MNVTSQILNALKNAMETALPSRHVTRSYQEFDRYHVETLKRGVITLLHASSDRSTDDLDSLDLLIVCQIQLAEKATTEQVEDAELELLADVRGFVDSVSNPGIYLGRARTSKQLEHPYGWATINAVVPNIDTYQMPDADYDALPDFVTFHADYELANNHENVTTADTVTLETTP